MKAKLRYIAVLCAAFSPGVLAQQTTNQAPPAREAWAAAQTQAATNQPAVSLGYQPQETRGPASPGFGGTWFPNAPYAPQPGPVAPAIGAAAGAPLSGTSQLGGVAPVPLAAAGAPDTPFRWGKLALRPHLAYQTSYGNNISYSPGNQASSWVHELSPGMLISLGDQWFLDYTPTMRWYSDPQLENGVDHRVFLNGLVSSRDWTFHFSQGYSKSFQPLIETGSQTEEESFSTSIRAGHDLNDRLSVDLGVAQDLRFVDGNSGGYYGLTDRKSWSTMNWLDYRYLEQLSFGMGAGFTYDDVSAGSDMTSQQVQGRANWRPGQKLTLSLSGGLDIRQFLDSGASDMVSPIFSFIAQYQIFEPTTLFAAASQTVSPAFYSDAVSTSTGLNAGINQRLLKLLYLNVSGGYTTTDYSATSSLQPSTLGNQESYSLSASLGTSFLKRANASIFYNKTWNNYGSSLYNYDPETIGAQVAYRF